MSTLLALPASAQQKGSDGNDEAKSTNDAAAKGNANAATAPVSRNVFALPAVPRATPFPAAAGSSSDESAPGRLVPRYEVAGGYSYVNFDPGNPFDSFSNHGATGSFAYNATRWLGLTAELGGYNFSRSVSPSSVNGSWLTYLFGPRLNLRRFDHFVPFAEFLVGASHAGVEVTGDAGGDKSAFALAAGGGVDVVLFKNLAWRFAQIDYLMTNFSGAFLGANSRQNNLRLGTGLVYRWGFPPPPPPPAPLGPPVAACSASPVSVFAGSNDTVAVHVNASSPESLPLTYSYTATGGTVDGTGPDARWNSSGAAVGSYTVNAKIDDGKGGTASCATDIRVEEKPHHPPTISCAPDRSPILPGERATITSTASSPDNLPLTYNYSATGGQISGNGPQAQFDSTGLQPGSYSVKCGVTDERGDKAEGTANVDVQQPPPPPQATKVGDCGYTKPGASRFDNLCKRVGDDVALRLKNDPNAKLVIVGFADPKEPKAAKLAASRADLAKAYLGEKGIDASRISTRTGEASKEKGAEKDNRRVDFVVVPEGATY
ncbi:MAG TPA: outer membrane beta-barrel protein [Pirellulales bacterium]|nr:outer membrane beta-barrel protein [Pirellulales bacterium]